MAHVTKNALINVYQQKDIILFVQIFTYTKKHSRFALSYHSAMKLSRYWLKKTDKKPEPTVCNTVNGKKYRKHESCIQYVVT